MTSSAKEPEAFAVPTDERIRLHIRKRIAPREHSAEGRHQPPGDIAGSSWFDLPLLEEGQLFPEEQILRGKGAVGTGREENEPTQVEHRC